MRVCVAISDSGSAEGALSVVVGDGFGNERLNDSRRQSSPSPCVAQNERGAARKRCRLSKGASARVLGHRGRGERGWDLLGRTKKDIDLVVFALPPFPPSRPELFSLLCI